MLEPGSDERARARLEGLGDLPLVCEHRDCSPWNILVTGAAARRCSIGSRPSRAACRLSTSSTSWPTPPSSSRARSRPAGPASAIARLLDPGTAPGAVAGECMRRYARELGPRPGPVRGAAAALLDRPQPLRPPPPGAGGGGPAAPGELRTSVFPGLFAEELRGARTWSVSPRSARARSQKRGRASPVRAFQITARAPSAAWTLTRFRRKGSVPAPLRPLSVVKRSRKAGRAAPGRPRVVVAVRVGEDANGCARRPRGPAASRPAPSRTRRPARCRRRWWRCGSRSRPRPSRSR